MSQLALSAAPPAVSTSKLRLGLMVVGFVLLWSSAFSAGKIAVFAALGVANQAVYLGIGYVALNSGVSAGLAALIISANPILTAVLAVALLGERITWQKTIGLVLGLASVAFIVRSRLILGTDQLSG